MKKSMRHLGFILVCIFLAQPIQAQNIHKAAREGDLTKVKDLLQADPALLEIKNENGKTPLHFAAEGGNPEVIQFLLERGAEINAQNIAGETPLHYAAGWGHLEAVKLLLDKKADGTLLTEEGDSALHYLRFVGHPEVAELLLDSGSDINQINKAGQSFLGMSVLAGRQQLIDLAFARGAEISPQEGTQMLIAAASAGNLSLADKLLAKGAAPEAKGDPGNRLLHAAAAGGHTKLVKELVKQGADLKSRSEGGGTLLHSAAQGNLLDLGKQLISQGVALDIQDRLQRTALHTSQDWGNLAFTEMLIKAGAGDLPRGTIWLSETEDQGPLSQRLEVAYIANEGFLISTPSTTILVDALFQNPFGYLSTPRPAFEKMKASAPPFKNLDLVMFSHAHRDHFEPQMVLDLLQKRHTLRMVGNSITIGELKQTAGTDFSAVISRITDLNPDWGTIQEITLAGVKIKAFPVNHAEADRPYVTLGFLMYLDDFTILHLGDINPPSNADIIPRYGFEKENIDIAFIDPFFLQNETGQALLKDHIRPKKIILMHMRPNEVDNYAQALGRNYDNLLVFHVPMQRKIFGKSVQ